MQIEVCLDPIELGAAALGKAPKGLDAVDMGAPVGEGLLLVDAHMLVVADIHQAIVTGPAIGADHASRVDPSSDDGPQSVRGAIPDDFRIDLPLALEDAEDLVA